MAAAKLSAKRYFIRGRVQGVGFRYFAQREAEQLGLRGYTRNLDDGRVEVYAVGTAEQLADFAGRLWTMVQPHGYVCFILFSLPCTRETP